MAHSVIPVNRNITVLNTLMPYASISLILELCNPWPHVAICHISISQLLSLWRHLLLSWPYPPLRACPPLRTYGHL